MKNLNKYEIILFVVLMLISYCIGRYLVPQDKVDISTELRQDNSHTQTRTITTKLPDGTIKRETVKDRVEQTQTAKKEVVTTPIIAKAKINVSLMAGYDVVHIGAPQYGVSVSKEVLGPLTAGVYGLSGGVIGVSLGYNF